MCVCVSLEIVYAFAFVGGGNQLLKKKCSLIYLRNISNFIGPLFWAWICKLYILLQFGTINGSCQYIDNMSTSIYLYMIVDKITFIS